MRETTCQLVGDFCIFLWEIRGDLLRADPVTMSVLRSSVICGVKGDYIADFWFCKIFVVCAIHTLEFLLITFFFIFILGTLRLPSLKSSLMCSSLYKRK